MLSYLVTEEARLQEFVAYTLKQDAFFFDIETMGEHRGVPHLNIASWLSLATHGAAIAVPHGHPIGSKKIGEYKDARLCADGKTRNYTMPIWDDPPPQLSTRLVYEITRPLFESEIISKVAHGASFDLASTAKYLGGVAARPFECNIVLDWVLNENRHAYGLKQRTKQEYGVTYDNENTGREVEKYPLDHVAQYSYLDAKYGWLHYLRNRPQIDQDGLEQVYNLELDILEIVVSMRLHGAHVDVPLIEKLREDLAERKVEATANVYRAAGRKLNINANAQKQDLLWGSKEDGGQGLVPWKFTATAKVKHDNASDPLPFTPRDYSTDSESLEEFVDNPVVRALVDYQEVAKLLSTYIDSWLGVDPDILKGVKGKDRLIHGESIYADFVQYGAKTRRWSCRTPNLQNIPGSGTELGTMIRNVFWAGPGRKNVVADYGQIEPRLMAHFIGEGMLYDGFWAGFDPYVLNAAAALNKDPADITRQERQEEGKTLMLAMGFGAQFRKIAAMLGCSNAQAKQLLRRHDRSMPEVAAYKEAVIINAKQQHPIPYVTTLLGGRRRLPELFSSSFKLRSYSERQAFNSKIQGSGADLLKLAMVYTFEGIRDIPETTIDLTVHDELVLSTPEEYADRVAQILLDAMTGPRIQSLVKVPLVTDVKVGDRWGNLH